MKNKKPKEIKYICQICNKEFVVYSYDQEICFKCLLEYTDRLYGKNKLIKE